MSEPLFDPSLKKKKKKTVAFTEDPLGADADPTAPAPDTIDSTTISGEAVDLGPKTAHEKMKAEAGEGDAGKAKEEDDFKAMFGDIKKKKKKKEIPLDFGDDSAPAAAPSGDGAAEGGDDLDFSDLKKKKKKKTKSAFDLEAFEKELNESKAKSGGDDEEDEDGAPVDTSHLDNIDEAELGDDPFAQPDAPTGVDAGTEAWLGTDRDYTYQELLTRFYNSLHAANPALLSSTTRKRYTIAPPQLFREGNKKSIFANVTEICKKMHRQPEHVIQFLFAEMGTTGSVDGAGRLVIRGRFQQKQIENVLRRYLVEYVTCKTCKSPDTLLTKENRIFFVACESCGSRRSVNAIKSGFQAQVGKRSKNKV
ncbi:translation initiation factor [Coprinopsis cinerea okayama7|uniref:Translation initiation factor n=1 Tax=Coprinopsis cinerea (strain Okayama-7 / 130 / ATCC MYA-4618 / FGSC 9003) TaxID=240176 RepID=A8P0R2_COPC7|nr:translation initiation factor [Coprinopsis cinerea okayama7\|eukprot:XP_001837946.2 translation initiation factor [Coprinopsis cinerea okayama7\